MKLGAHLTKHADPHLQIWREAVEERAYLIFENALTGKCRSGMLPSPIEGQEVFVPEYEHLVATFLQNQQFLFDVYSVSSFDREIESRTSYCVSKIRYVVL